MVNWKSELIQSHLDTAAELYGVLPGGIGKVGGFENLVYSFDRNGERYILRVSHSSHREAKQIVAEMEWTQYLAEQGVGVARPLPSVRGEWLETIASESGLFYLAAFERASGEHVFAGHREWGPRLFEEWGYITGQMHVCAKSPGIPATARQRVTVDDVPAGPHPDEQMLHRKFLELRQQILELPRSRDNYGLCHRDLHHGNFFVHNGHITAFDFDDCGYDYFAQDIAMAVYYASVFSSWGSPVSDVAQASEFANRFLTSFMTGYTRANRLDADSFKQLPLFIEKRRIDLSLILFGEFGSDNPNRTEREWLEEPGRGKERATLHAVGYLKPTWRGREERGN